MNKPVVGLIALHRDEVIESDMHTLIGRETVLITTRIPLPKVGSREDLLNLSTHLSSASALLPVGSNGVIAFACTSGAALIGATEIRDRVRSGRPDPGISVVTPLDGMRAGLHAFNAKRVALVTPYGPTVSTAISGWLDESGFVPGPNLRIPGEYTHYADIPAEAIAEVAVKASREADAVLVACTDLRALSIIEDVERTGGTPVITSNQALGWVTSQTLGIKGQGPGLLYGL